MTSLADKDCIILFYAEDVTIYHVRDDGERVFCPANVSIRTVKSRDKKGVIFANNDLKNAVMFNAVIPGNVPIFAIDEDRSVMFGKVPSLSYTNEEGKCIPTMWRFKFKKAADFESFYGLLLVFADLGKLVNDRNPLPPKSVILPKTELLTPTKKIILESSDEESPNLLEDASTIEHSPKKRSPVNYSFTDDSSADFGSPIFARSQDIVVSMKRSSVLKLKNNNAGSDKKKAPADYFISGNSSADFGSPIFAESQDIVAAVKNNSRDRKSAEWFSPMSEGTF